MQYLTKAKVRIICAATFVAVSFIVLIEVLPLHASALLNAEVVMLPTIYIV